MQVDHIKPKLKALGTNVSKLKYDGPLSNFAFKFNVRLFSKYGHTEVMAELLANGANARQGLTLVPISAQLELVLSTV